MECPIDSMDLPITGEASHQIGDCHCYLCTCGNHICPSNLTYKRSHPANTYSSIYQKDFAKKLGTDSLRYVREGELLLSSQKMDLQTTQRSSYHPHGNSYFNKPAEVSASPVSYKFSTSSTYQANYPDWKHYYTFDYRLRNKYTGSPLKFTALSTYGQDFKEFSPQQPPKRSEFRTPSLIGCKESDTGQTIHQLSYKHHKSDSVTKHRSVSSTDDYITLENVEIASTYQKNFLPHVNRNRVPTKKQSLVTPK